jgi:uncharacterized OsmC-like protein
MMPDEVPGTIRLGKFKAVCKEERESAEPNEGYVLEQRAIIRLNDDLVRINRAEDYTVLCDEENFHKSAGKRPSPLQYFIASIGFCMFSQMARFAKKLDVSVDDAEMDLRMTYDLRVKKRPSDFSTAAQDLAYLLKLKSSAPAEKVLRVASLTDKGCHTVNSMRKRVPVTGKLLLNDKEFAITD